MLKIKPSQHKDISKDFAPFTKISNEADIYAYQNPNTIGQIGYPIKPASVMSEAKESDTKEINHA